MPELTPGNQGPEDISFSELNERFGRDPNASPVINDLLLEAYGLPREELEQRLARLETPEQRYKLKTYGLFEYADVLIPAQKTYLAEMIIGQNLHEMSGEELQDAYDRSETKAQRTLLEQKQYGEYQLSLSFYQLAIKLVEQSRLQNNERSSPGAVPPFRLPGWLRRALDET